MTQSLPRRERPCNNCPWRKDSPPGEFPAHRYAVLRATAGSAGREVGLTAPVFACHKSPEGNERACAGWLAVCGYQHLGMRLAVAQKRLPTEALAAPPDDWPELFSSYDELVARNEVGAWD